MEKQPIKPRKFKVYMVVILILLIPILFFSIKAYGYNENLYWRGGAGNISDKSHWFNNNGNSNCACIPVATSNSVNTVYFDSSSGSGIIYLDINISSGPIHFNNANIQIVLLNDTKWTLYDIRIPTLSVPINPPFNVLQTLTSAFYILMFITSAILFIMFAFWVRRVRGKIG